MDWHLHVGHRRERLLYAGQGGGESQQSAHAQRYPGRGRLVVDPEGEPGDDDDHDAGDVHGDQEVRELPGEDQVHLETAVLPCSQCGPLSLVEIKRGSALIGRELHSVAPPVSLMP